MLFTDSELRPLLEGNQKGLKFMLLIVAAIHFVFAVAALRGS